MGKVVAQILLWGLILSLLAFTAIRTLHFLGLTFPADQSYMSWLGLAAFDGGVLLWFFFATRAATGHWQTGLSYLMIAVCMLGVVICTVADMLLVSSGNGLVHLPPNTAIVALYGVIAVIVINVVAGTVVHLLSPAHMQHMAEERARARIQTRVLQNIEGRADAIADDIAERLGAEWEQQAYRNMTGLLPSPKKKGIVVAEEPTQKS